MLFLFHQKFQNYCIDRTSYEWYIEYHHQRTFSLIGSVRFLFRHFGGKLNTRLLLMRLNGSPIISRRYRYSNREAIIRCITN